MYGINWYLLFLFIFITGSLAASGSGWDSAKIWNGSPAPTWSTGKTVAVDSNNDYWVAGIFNNGKLKFGTTTITATGADISVAKLSSTGSPLVALKFENSNLNVPIVTCSAIDSSNNVWIYGSYQGTLTFGSNVLTSTGHDSVYLLKLSSTGTVILSLSSISNNHVAPGKLAIDSSDNVYIVGSYTGPMSIGSLSLPSATYNDVFTIKLTSSGVPTISRVSSGSGSHYSISWGITLDVSGNVYIAGRYNGIASFGTTTLPAASIGNVFIAKLNSALLWQTAVSGVQSGGSTPFAEAFDIKLDNSNNLFITGRFITGSGGTLMLGSKSLSSISYDVFIAQLSLSLVFSSANQGFTSDGKGVALTRDNTGSIWNTGVVKGINSNFSGTIVSSNNYNYYLSKISSGSVFTSFTSGASSSGASIPASIAIGSNNKIAMTGDAVGSVSFGNNKVNPGSQSLYTSVYII